MTCVNQTWVSTALLFGFWKFENDYTDETNTYNGVANGSVPFVQGYSGQAVSFIGNASQVISTPHIPLANQSFSADAWIYPIKLNVPIHMSICGMCPSAVNDYCLHLTLKNISGYPWSLYFGLYGDDISTNGTVAINIWTHVAFTFDSSSKRVYVYKNGIVLNTGTTSSQFKATTGSFQIGNLPILVTTVNTFQVEIIL